MAPSFRRVLQSMQMLLAILLPTMTFLPVQAMATDTPLRGNLLAGQVVRAECPAGSYLVGFAGRSGAWIDQIAPVCEPLLPDKQTFGKFSIGHTIGTSTGGSSDHARCQTGTVIRATRHSMTVGDGGAVKYVESISSDCFTTAGVLTANHSFGTPTSHPTIDLTSKPLDELSLCPNGEFARGFQVRAGQFMYAFGLICGPLTPLKPGTVPPVQAKNMPSALPTAPTINLPQGFVVKGNGLFKITPSQYLSGSHAQIQLKWLNPPVNLKGKGLDFYNYEVPMSLIGGPGGVAAPDVYLAPGTWEIQVRVNQPRVGDWSQPVRFEYYLQSPAAAPIQETPLNVEGQKKRGTSGTGATVFRPQTTPSQSLGNTMVIMPRGVDEQGGTESHETSDQPIETDKKP